MDIDWQKGDRLWLVSLLTTFFTGTSHLLSNDFPLLDLCSRWHTVPLFMRIMRLWLQLNFSRAELLKLRPETGLNHRMQAGNGNYHLLGQLILMRLSSLYFLLCVVGIWIYNTLSNIYWASALYQAQGQSLGKTATTERDLCPWRTCDLVGSNNRTTKIANKIWHDKVQDSGSQTRELCVLIRLFTSC